MRTNISDHALPPIAREVADFVLSASWEGLPAAVRRETQRSFLNWVGCAAGGSNTETVRLALHAIAQMSGSGDNPILGRRARCDAVNAALVNCLSASAHAFDDTHLKTITHPTAPVAAAAMATMHARAATGAAFSGKDLLLAVAIGIEIECRLSNAVLADGRGADLAWYVTGISGGVGGAVAAGRLLGLDHARLVSAIGLAAAQACGVRSTHGSMATAYVPAVAARNGLTAAYMAASGFTCSEGSLDGRNGLLQGLSRNADVQRIRRGLGEDFELLENAYKPYPCGIVIHPSIDACLALLADPRVSAQAIERLDLRVHPDALNLCWRKFPDTALDAQVSLFHWAAATLVQGKAGIDQSELPSVQDAGVRAMQKRIFATASPDIANDAAAARLVLKSGDVLDVHVDHAIGSAANPMTDAQLDQKFFAMTRRVLDEGRTYRLLQACRDMESSANPLEIFHIATPDHQGDDPCSITMQRHVSDAGICSAC